MPSNTNSEPFKLMEVFNDEELNKFIQFPYRLYQCNPFWIPQLKKDEVETLSKLTNPAFEHCEARYWLVLQGKNVVGRIAAIINHQHKKVWGQNFMRFGWFDFVDNLSVSSLLVGAAEAWAQESNIEALHGPLGFTNLDHAGMLIDGFSEMSTMATNYNYPYYSRHIEALGFQKHTDWVEFEISIPPEPNEKITRISEMSKRRYQLRILQVTRRKELLPYGRELFRIYNEEYKKLYSAIPLSPVQVDKAIKQYIRLFSPKFIPIIVDHNDQMVAFGIVLPSLSRALQKANGALWPLGLFHLLSALQKNKQADLYLIAVKNEYQGKGVNAILMDHIHRTFLKMGIQTIETNPELEWNANVHGQWKYYNKRQHKRRRVYIKYLG